MQMWATFGIVAVAITLFATELLALELVALGVVAALLLLFHFAPLTDEAGSSLLGPEVLLSGFANPALITVLALLVIGQGLQQSGALDGLINRLATHSRDRGRPMLVYSLLVAGIVSAFMNNTPVVVMFIPVIAALAGRFRLGASTMLMPLSFIAILGGMLTLIGSSTNLLVAGLASDALKRQMSFFELTAPGLVLATAGALYTLFVLPRLLVGRAGKAETRRRQSGRQFIAQLDISDDHPLIGATSVAGLFRELPGITVQMILRRGNQVLPPFEGISLKSGDTVTVATTRRALTEALHLRGDMEPNARPDSAEVGSGSTVLAEAAVAPGSRLADGFVSRDRFWARTGCRILGVQRQGRMRRQRLDTIRLHVGDVLLISGPSDAMAKLRLERDLMVLEGSISDLPSQQMARRALIIFAATILPAALGIAPVVVATVCGALAMVASRCLNTQQATRAINMQIVLLVGAGFAMALALQATGGAHYLSMELLRLFDGAGVAVILSVLFLIVAVMTNVLSNNATALIFTPIAISLAADLDADPTAFVHAVIFAANCSFMSPIGYQTNLLVMGPGNYSYRDFVRVGTPLALIIWLVFTGLAHWYYTT